MAPITFTNRDQQIINAFADATQDATSDSTELKETYPEYLKILKFHFPTLSKSVLFLNRYLVPQVTDTDQLELLSTNLENYIKGRGMTQDTYQEWSLAHKNIQALLDDETLFNQNIVRENSIQVSLYTENLNTDEDKFSTIQTISDVDDGSKSLFVENPMILTEPE